MLVTLTQVEDLDLELLDKKIDQMMPELGFTQEDNDRLVASYSGGWQMRMCLGKMLLQEPDLLLLDEPTNHLDLDAIQVCAVGCIGPGADTIRVHAALHRTAARRIALATEAWGVCLPSPMLLTQVRCASPIVQG